MILTHQFIEKVYIVQGDCHRDLRGHRQWTAYAFHCTNQNGEKDVGYGWMEKDEVPVDPFDVLSWVYPDPSSSVRLSSFADVLRQNYPKGAGAEGLFPLDERSVDQFIGFLNYSNTGIMKHPFKVIDTLEPCISKIEPKIEGPVKPKRLFQL